MPKHISPRKMYGMCDIDPSCISPDVSKHILECRNCRDDFEWAKVHALVLGLDETMRALQNFRKSRKTHGYVPTWVYNPKDCMDRLTLEDIVRIEKRAPLVGLIKNSKQCLHLIQCDWCSGEFARLLSVATKGLSGFVTKEQVKKMALEAQKKLVKA